MTKIDPETVAEMVKRLRDPWQHKEELCVGAADMLEALAARVAELEASCDAVMKDRAFIMRERDETFALMLARAEAAEAKLAAKGEKK